jgi:predicted HAD superfamily hydrolase
MKSGRLFCYDVFDTILTRRVGEPVWAFFILGQRLRNRAMISMSPREFLEVRVAAEKHARSKQPDCSLVEIWLELGDSLGMMPGLRNECLDEELRVEEELIQAVPGAKERIAGARRRGKIAFVSDMYLPSSFIEQQLRRHGLWAPDSSLYVSADWRRSKVDGSLFRVALECEESWARCTFHLGDNPNSDIVGARTAGLRARLYSGCSLNRYEKILQAASFETESIGSFMAGASRLARLEAAFSRNGDQRRALAEVASGVAAPTLTAYLIFVFQRAQELGIDRIYFVSRDGQVLSQMARELAKRWTLKFDLRYLYGSRQAWHLASFRSADERQLDWIMAETTFLSAETALARVCLDPGDVQSALSKAGFKQSDWRRNLTSEERKRLRSVFIDGAVSKRIAERAVARRRLCLSYFAQEGLFETVKSAIVDVGWTGKMLDSLAAILRDAGANAPYGFYFGLVGQQNCKRDALSPREGFYIDALRKKSEPVVLNDRATILEMFCAGDHGQVQAYEDRNGAVEPILREPSNTLVLDWGLQQFRKSVAEFVANFGWQYRPSSDFESLAKMIGSVMHEFWHNPSKEEALFWGSFPYFDDQTEAYWNQLASPYTFGDMFRQLRGREIRKKHVHSWDSARRVLSPAVIRAGLKWGDGIATYRRKLGSKLRQLGLRKSAVSELKDTAS